MEDADATNRTRHPRETHGHTRNGRPTPTWNSWHNMHKRCKNPRAAGWANYGGRNITVCARWDDFALFVADMGERLPGMSLDRIDNDGNYEPGNCRWATGAEQQANKRPYQKERRVLDLNNDQDYEEYIRLQNLPEARETPRRHSPGQFKTPVRQNPDHLDYN